MDSHRKPKNNYDRVMSRVYNRSRSSLRSGSNVTRHEVPSSGRVGAKPSVSAVTSSVFSELPTVLNDYVPEVDRNKVGKRVLVKPRRTLTSLDPGKAKSPQRASRARALEYGRNIRARGSAPVLSSKGEEWAESHLRQCYSSRSHTRLKELKDEIKAFHETDKLMKLRSHLYTRCGVVLDDTGRALQDQAVQASPEPDKENTSLSFPEDPLIKNKWIEATGRKNWFPTKHSRICSIHFHEDAFTGPSKYRRIISTAYPTIDVVIMSNNEKNINEPSTSDETSIQTPKKKKIMNQLIKARQMIKEKDKQIKCLKERNRRQRNKILSLVALITRLKKKTLIIDEQAIP